MYIRDDPVMYPTPIADPVDALAELARTGAATMVDMRDGGFHEEAHKAWAGIFFGAGRRWPELTLDGAPSRFEDALSNERLDAALRKTKQKAVGADGFDVVWLRLRDGAGPLIPEDVRRDFY